MKNVFRTIKSLPTTLILFILAKPTRKFLEANKFDFMENTAQKHARKFQHLSKAELIAKMDKEDKQIDEDIRNNTLEYRVLARIGITAKDAHWINKRILQILEA